MPDITFKRLQISGWRQFAKVDIEFHERLTVLTGANGAGKSTLLNVLARHVGSERPYLGVPKWDAQGTIIHLSGRLTSKDWWTRLFGIWKWSPPDQVGEIEYSNGLKSALIVPQNVGATFGLGVPNQQNVIGTTIGSHRTLSAYQRLPDHVMVNGFAPSVLFDWVSSEVQQRYLGAGSGHSIIYHLKNALTAWAIKGEGNAVIAPDPRQAAAYAGFVELLRKLLPSSLGFTGLEIRFPDVVLTTKSGEFLIDAASGGITTLIEIGALIYGFSIRPDLQGQKLVVIYDEPENHLHPQLQRTLFSNLIEAFPRIQFITATHSPFIVSSLKDSNVYVLRYEDTKDEVVTENSRVVSQKLDYVNRAGSASEILREVLGLPSTLPQWVDESLTQIVLRFEARDLTKAVLEELKTALNDAGLAEFYPDALASIARSR